MTNYVVRIYPAGSQRPLTLPYAPSFEAAKELIGDGIFQIEEDPTAPNHFDGLTTRCEVFTIEPLKN